MDSSRYFTITLSSSDKSDQNNSLANFKTILGKEKILDGNWVVALSGMHYTKSWYNYESESALVSVVNQCVDTASELITEYYLRTRSDSKNTSQIILPRLDFAQRSRIMTIKSGKVTNDIKLFLSLPNVIEEMLGITRRDDAYSTDNLDDYVIEDNLIDILPKIKKRKNKTKIKIVSDIIKGKEDAYKCYDLNCGIHSLFVYCNLIDSVIVGNSFAPLLRTIPVQNKKFGDQCHQIFNKPYFYPLATNNFQCIQTSIRNKTGNLIPFKFGETTIVLEFKKI